MFNYIFFRFHFLSSFLWRKVAVLFLVAVSFSCRSPESPTPVQLEYPEYFPAPVDIPSRNPLTLEGIELGRKLFFDPALSASGKVSCASCHVQSLSFADGQALSSVGVGAKSLQRNSPALINLAWMNHLFWDGGVKNLESVPFAALTNPNEMAGDLKEISNYLNENSAYRNAFEIAFGIDSISSAYVARALAQFQRTLISADAKYDRVQMGQESFSMDEIEGEKIFRTKCASCHIPPLFTDNQFHNNGPDSIFPLENENVRAGRYRVTLDSADIGKFKTPTLRNLKFTFPYMHDGRFATLDEVLAHYQTGILHSTTLDEDLRNLKLSDDEVRSLGAFLKTLNDKEFVNNPIHSNQGMSR